MRKIMTIVLVVFCTGCANSTGWRVTFGVAPIKSLEDKQGLAQEQEQRQKQGRY